MEAGSGGYMNREWRQDLEATEHFINCTPKILLGLSNHG
jgi:hypothetical protein